ncbi:unnamed protein product [Ectocarpus sp. 8 AP-2014]
MAANSNPWLHRKSGRTNRLAFASRLGQSEYTAIRATQEERSKKSKIFLLLDAITSGHGMVWSVDAFSINVMEWIALCILLSILNGVSWSIHVVHGDHRFKF